MSTNVYTHQMPDDLTQCFTLAFCSVWADCGHLIIADLRWMEKHRHLKMENLTSRDIFSRMRPFMPRKSKDVKNDSGNRSGSDSSSMSRSGLRWFNIELDDDDFESLEQSDLSFESVFSSIASLAMDGYAVSIRTVDSGKSFCVSLIRSDPNDNSVAYGLSGFGGELRDAGLTCLYKFEHYLRGSFDSGSEFLAPTQQKRRFR